MRSGRLRHRVALSRYAPTDDGQGGQTPAWTPLGSRWAAVEPIRGREAMIGGQMLSITDTRIILRAGGIVDTLTTRDRITHAGVVYDIVSMAEIRLIKHEVEFMAKSGGNNG